MAKRDHDESQFIKINPLTNSAESLISVAILNALVILEADKNPLVKIPTRKELTKLLRNAKFENVCKALDEVNGIRIRPVPNMESTGTAGIVQIDHPVKPIYCSVYRKEGETGEFDLKLVNSGLGDDVVSITEATFNSKLLIDDAIHYQILLNTGEKQEKADSECSCEDCNRYYIGANKEDVCLYDNNTINDTSICCNKYLDCFRWRKPKEN